MLSLPTIQAICYSFISEGADTKDPERTDKSGEFHPSLASTVHTYNCFLCLLRIDVVFENDGALCVLQLAFAAVLCRLSRSLLFKRLRA